MNTGIYEIEKTEILQLDPFLKYGKPAKIASFFGGKSGYLKAVQELEKEILRLSTGRTVELSPELKEAMEGLGIHVVYGMEWLERNGNTEQENLDLVERNPFLPYALLMTERELERLRAAALPVYTSAPIPVVVRESLADQQRVYTEDALPGTGVHFYMLFNRNLLNEERLQALLEQKQRELERKNEEIEHRRTEHREYLERRTRINAQKVTRRDYEETRAGIDELERLGFTRAVLARELSISEIESIHKHNPMPLEVFVHGALCVCISGTCYLSSIIGGRSGNRGRCAQVYVHFLYFP
jgi:hypothetical protein